MTYNEALAQRIREVLGEGPELSERKMFGGIAFMSGGNMVCGVIRDDLMVRVGPDAHEKALAEPHTRPMEMMAGRPMKGMVAVSPAGVQREDLRRWVEWGLRVARALPAKKR